jgi:hypothetical protein
VVGGWVGENWSKMGRGDNMGRECINNLSNTELIILARFRSEKGIKY